RCTTVMCRFPVTRPLGTARSYLLFFFQCHDDHRDLHSFPTRRSSDLSALAAAAVRVIRPFVHTRKTLVDDLRQRWAGGRIDHFADRKSTRLNSSHDQISYAVFCLKKKRDPADDKRGVVRNTPPGQVHE